MLKKLIVLAVLLSLTYAPGVAQPDTTQRVNHRRLQSLLTNGQQLLRQQRFYRAEAYLNEALVTDARSAAAHYYLAECQRHRFRYAEALSSYQAAARLDTARFPAVGFYIALMQKYTGAYAAAHRGFTDYIAQHQATEAPTKKYVARAREEIRGIERAYQSQPPTQDVGIRRLSAPLNSPFHDYAARVAIGDSSLIVTSARPGGRGDAPEERYGESYGDFFFFEKKQGRWQAASAPLANLNTPQNEGNGVFTAEGDQFYFTGCYQDSTCRILTSQRIGERWSDPLPLGSQINSVGYNAKHPALSPGGDTLYFTSDRPGGYGQFDVWMSVRRGGSWQPAVNVGPAINSAYNEVSPTCYARESALVFASDRPTGIGGYDLYVVLSGAASPDSLVVSMGYPFNSSQDDLFFSGGSWQAFLTSNRNNEDGNFDLYALRLPPRTIDAIARQQFEKDTDPSEPFLFADFFAPKDRRFFEQLSREDKEKVTRYIDRRAFREAVVRQASPVDSVFEYEALSPLEKRITDRLVRAQKQFLRKEPTDAFLPEDAHDYQNLSPEEKERIDQAVEAQWLKILLQNQIAPDTAAIYFYEQLPLADQQKVERAVRRRQRLHQQTLAELPRPSDLFYYESLPPAEKTALAQMVIAQQFVEKEWKTQSDPTLDYLYEQLDATEQQQVKHYIRRQSFQAAMAEETVLSEEAQHYYETLSEQEKASVDRLAQSRKQFLMREQPTDEVLPADEQFYQRLPTEEKEVIDQIVNARTFALLQLEKSEDAAPAMRVYQQLPAQDQEQISRVVAQRKAFYRRTFRQLPTVEDKLTYEALSEEKQRVRQNVEVRLFDEAASEDPPIASLIFRYENLSPAEKERADRLVRSQRFLPRTPDAPHPPVASFPLAKIDERPTERVTIRGRLSSPQNAFPSRAYLVNSQNDTLATAPVKANGTFVFAAVDYEERQRVAFERSARRFTPSDYTIEELAIVPPSETPSEQKAPRFGKFFFATNQFQLPPTAAGTLDSLVQFHRQHPQTAIEIRAFADSTGAPAYNIQLTQRRALSVVHYLEGHGVDPNYLTRLAMGSIPGDDLAYCRRVELVVGDSSYYSSSAKVIYIIQAQPDLPQIAERYQVSLEELNQWNDGKELSTPYTPVRVVIRD